MCSSRFVEIIVVERDPRVCVELYLLQSRHLFVIERETCLRSTCVFVLCKSVCWVTTAARREVKVRETKQDTDETRSLTRNKKTHFTELSSFAE